ncbi:Syntaxin-binding protein 3, partial [Phlyctochytrium bullatum]
VSDELMDELKPALSSAFLLKRLDEINVQFIPLESQAFHLGLGESMVETYGAKSEEALDASISKISSRLLDFLITLGDAVDIRYYDPSGRKATLSSRLAYNLHGRVEGLRSIDPNLIPTFPDLPYSALNHDWSRSSVLVLVDRSLDLLTPLLHILSYQSLMHDFYEIREDIRGEEKHLVCDFNPTLAAIMDESDEIFQKIRHQFYLTARRTIEQERLAHLQQRSDARKQMDLNQSMAQIESDFRQFMHMALHKDDIIQRGSQIAALVQISKSTDEIIESSEMERFFGLEQDLAVGETYDGDELFEPFEELMELLDDENEEILPRDKLRIFLIYLLTMGGLTRPQMIAHARKAKFKENDALILKGLERMGVMLEMKRNPREPISPFTVQRRRELEPLPAAYLATHEGERFVPANLFIIRDLLICKANTMRIFPSVRETLKAERELRSKDSTKGRKFMEPIKRQGGPGKVLKFKSFQPTWACKCLPHRPLPEAEAYRKNGPRLIFFVVGGVTYSEIKVAYDLTKLMERDVIVGSTHITTPADFVEDLFTLGGHPPKSSESETNVPVGELGDLPIEAGDASFPHDYFGQTMTRGIPLTPRSASSMSNSSTAVNEQASPQSDDGLDTARSIWGEPSEVKSLPGAQAGPDAVFSTFGRGIQIDEEEEDDHVAAGRHDYFGASRSNTARSTSSQHDYFGAARSNTARSAASQHDYFGATTTVRREEVPESPQFCDDDHGICPHCGKPRKKKNKTDENGWEHEHHDASSHHHVSALHRLRRESVLSPQVGGHSARTHGGTPHRPRDEQHLHAPTETNRRGSTMSVTNWSFTTTKVGPGENPNNSVWEIEGPVGANGTIELPPAELLGLLAAGSPTLKPALPMMDSGANYGGAMGTSIPLSPGFYDKRSPIPSPDHPHHRDPAPRGSPTSIQAHRPASPAATTRQKPPSSPATNGGGTRVRLEPVTVESDSDWEQAMRRMAMSTPELAREEEMHRGAAAAAEARGAGMAGARGSPTGGRGSPRSSGMQPPAARKDSLQPPPPSGDGPRSQARTGSWSPATGRRNGGDQLRHASMSAADLDADASETRFGGRRRRDSTGARGGASKRLASPPPPPPAPASPPRRAASMQVSKAETWDARLPPPDAPLSNTELLRLLSATNDGEDLPLVRPEALAAGGVGVKNIPPRRPNRVPTKVFYDATYLEKGGKM